MATAKQKLLIFFAFIFCLLQLDLLDKLLSFYVKYPNQFFCLKSKHFLKCYLTLLKELRLCIRLYCYTIFMNNYFCLECYYHFHKTDFHIMDNYFLITYIHIIVDLSIIVFMDMIYIMHYQSMDYKMSIQNFIANLCLNV